MVGKDRALYAVSTFPAGLLSAHNPLPFRDIRQSRLPDGLWNERQTLALVFIVPEARPLRLAAIPNWLQAPESNRVFRGYEPRDLPFVLPAELV